MDKIEYIVSKLFCVVLFLIIAPYLLMLKIASYGILLVHPELGRKK